MPPDHTTYPKDVVSQTASTLSRENGSNTHILANDRYDQANIVCLKVYCKYFAQMNKGLQSLRLYAWYKTLSIYTGRRYVGVSHVKKHRLYNDAFALHYIGDTPSETWLRCRSSHSCLYPIR